MNLITKTQNQTKDELRTKRQAVMHSYTHALMQSLRNLQSKIIILLILSFAIIIPTASYTQQLERMWYYVIPAGFGFEDVAVNAQGSIYATGTGYDLIASNSDEDYFTVKLNPLTGDTIWTRIYGRQNTNGSYNNDLAKKIALDLSGNIYVAGASHTLGEGTPQVYEFVTIKYSPEGNVLWIAQSAVNFLISRQALINDYFDMEISPAGNIYIAGERVILKYNQSGKLLWGVNATGVTIKALAVDSDENVIVTGLNSTQKYRADGDLLWSVPNVGGCPFGSATPVMRDITLDALGNVYICGYTCNDGNNNFGYYKTFRKYTENGAVLSTVNINTPQLRSFYSIILDNSNDLYLGGFDPILKYTNTGNPIWAGEGGGQIAGLYGTGSLITFYNEGIQNQNQRLAEYSRFNGTLLDTAVFRCPAGGSFTASIISQNGDAEEQIISVGYFDQEGQRKMLATVYSKQEIPMTPGSLTASFILDSIRLNFEDRSIIETGFKVQKSSNSGANWTDAVMLPAFDGPYPFRILKTIHNTTGGSGNLFRVCAFNNNGQSDWIGNNGVKYPSAPAQLTANYGPGNLVTLKWKDYSRIETGYKIERKILTDTSFQQIGVTGANAVTYIDDQLPSPSSGEEYQYRVRAFLNSINSEYSNTASVVFQAPLATDSLRVNVPEIGTAVLSWIPGSGNEEGYVLERSINSSANFIFLDSIPAGDTAYADSGLTPGTTYWYRLYAYNPLGNSPYSDTVLVLITGSLTGSDVIPMSYALYQNFPNPFNPVTQIRFDLPHSSHVRLMIYDILGREVVTLINEIKPAGRYNIDWNAGSFSSGVYFYKLDAGEFVDIKRLVLLK